MGFIYKISNDINDKIYIGKTNFSLEKRWQQHINDSHKDRHEHRPLYNAINKYGIEHFQITLIEEIPNEQLSVREQYWINYYNSYSNGYNATMGGEGKTKFNYDQVVELYNKYQNVRKVAEELSADRTAIEDILHSMNVKVLPGCLVSGKKTSKPVAQIDPLTNEIIAIFSNAREASEQTGAYAKSISKTCLGKQVTCGGYKWKYV